MPDGRVEPKLTDRDQFALAKYYVRMFRIIADEQLYQRRLLERICEALIVDIPERK